MTLYDMFKKQINQLHTVPVVAFYLLRPNEAEQEFTSEEPGFNPAFHMEKLVIPMTKRAKIAFHRDYKFTGFGKTSFPEFERRMS